MQWIYAVTALLNVIAAILAWATTRRWKRDSVANYDEIIRAKNQQIQSLSREIEMLQDLEPIKIHEYFLTLEQRLKKYESG